MANINGACFCREMIPFSIVSILTVIFKISDWTTSHITHQQEQQEQMLKKQEHLLRERLKQEQLLKASYWILLRYCKGRMGVWRIRVEKQKEEEEPGFWSSVTR
ncbi:hypothetical protein BT69DRAFT_1325064 [Atractiella rhizophila]|nr:hypothetical protein BT69DRAFT_1325064 [Atractiella rhizophila]